MSTPPIPPLPDKLGYQAMMTPSSSATVAGPVSGGEGVAATSAQPGTPDPGRQKWHLVVAESADEARSGTAYVMSVTALLVWAVQYFGFHGDLPGAVSAALYVIVPTTITWLSTHVAFRKVTL